MDAPHASARPLFQPNRLLTLAALAAALLALDLWLGSTAAWAEPTAPPGATTRERDGYESIPATSANLGIGWSGYSAGEANLRRGPSTEFPISGQLSAGEPVKVLRWINGQEVETQNPVWADLGAGRYLYSSNLRSDALPQLPPAIGTPLRGRWLDVNLTVQIMTAYGGGTPVRSFLISSGRPGWPSPGGTHKVLRRVENETMDGSTLIGQGPGGAGDTYHITDVLWTQYYTTDGDAIHTNYWKSKDQFGIPTSHGCIGMPEPDAHWVWNFATVGTPMVVHF
jgi:hypothetical protein